MSSATNFAWRFKVYKYCIRKGIYTYSSVQVKMNSFEEDAISPVKGKSKMSKDNGASKKLSPDGSRRLLLSPVKKLSALRLVSPIDSDQELNDLEVASVLAEGKSFSAVNYRQIMHGVGGHHICPTTTCVIR